ncbi:MAG: hypothetical protein ABSD48_15965 [Armatimonadota bacterium]|jgi:hypothetical protein
MNTRFYMRQLFCDWHVPSFLDEIVIDCDDYFRGIAKTGAEALIFHAKNAHGNTFYPTGIGTPNRSIGGDLFGEVCRRAKAQGLQFLAYYNVVLSHELGRTHPEWQQVGWDGQRLVLAALSQFPSDTKAACAEQHTSTAHASAPVTA